LLGPHSLGTARFALRLYPHDVADGAAPTRLTEDQIEALVARLRAGEYLDEYMRSLLFRQAKEYELEYEAKTPKSRILSDTMGVPLQPLKRFGSAANGWTNRLVFGDNLQVLKTLLEMKNRGELLNADGSSGVRLCYIDPPFATRQEFQGRRGARAYRDKVAGAAFVEFLRKRLVFLYELLADDGVLYLHLDTRKVHYLKVVLDEIFGEHNFQSEIIWKRTSAHNSARRWGPVHDSILMYSKTGLYRWNEVFQELSTGTADQWYNNVEPDTGRRYNRADLTAPGVRTGSSGSPWRGVDPTAKGRHWAIPRLVSLLVKGLDTLEALDELDRIGRLHWPKSSDGVPMLKRYLDESRGTSAQDVITDVYVNNVAAERVGYPTQKPEALLQRIIEASSDEGDIVLDCFSGSGTAVAVAERLKRRWIAVDCGKLAIYITQRRLLGGRGAAKQLMPAAFELCTAGLYDNDIVEDMDFDGFQAFCLELFGCRAHAHQISGIQMAGTRKAAPVHFFPFKETETEMGSEYLHSLAGRLRGKVSGEVYVVAPVTSCDPGLFEDVVSIGKITFFILRVPYSVIEALHGRRFKLLDQPFSAQMLNDPMETFGFDFMQLPEVRVSYAKTKTQITGSIKTFRRGGLDPDDFDDLEEAGRLDLAMVLVDRDYDGDVFRVSDHFFGDELEAAEWKFSLPLSECGDRMLVIYVDTHGNEFRETVELSKTKAQRASSKAAA
jgi:DNA modification methylase